VAGDAAAQLGCSRGDISTICSTHVTVAVAAAPLPCTMTVLPLAAPVLHTPPRHTVLFVVLVAATQGATHHLRHLAVAPPRE
jgi:hypothetical protein